MDYQSFVDCVDRPCAVLSVEKEAVEPRVRVVSANRYFKEISAETYYDGVPYYELFPKNLKFEDFCYHAAGSQNGSFAAC